MISMARIQGPAMGYSGFQKPIIQMGQNSFSSGPVGAGVAPPAAPVQDFNYVPQYPGYVVPPNYAYPVQEVPVVPATTPSTTPTAMPTWAVIGLAVAAVAVVTVLVMK